jgi:hypothetical protein
VEHDAEREHVDAPVDRLAANLLRRQVGELALDGAGARVVQLRGRLGDAEVEHLGGAVLADVEVVGRDVAVHDAERLAFVVARHMGVMQATSGVGDDAHGHAQRQLDAGARRSAQHLDARLSAQVLEGDVAGLADLPGFECLDEVAVAQALAEAPLVNEELHELGVRGVVRQDALDDHEAMGAGLLGEEDLGHAAEGQGADDAIAPELIGERTRPGACGLCPRHEHFVQRH